MRTLVAQTRLILRNDLRVLWRELLSGKLQLFSNIGMMVVMVVMVQGMMFLVLFATRGGPPLMVETVIWSFIALLMFGAAMNHAIGVLFERSDFDLLLSSPMSPRAILLARWSAIGIGAASTVAIFVAPLINAAALFRTPRYLHAYLVWFLLGVMAASVGVWATLLLVRWIGPRQARVWGQVFAGVLGASIYLLMQGQNLLPKEIRGSVQTYAAAIFEFPALTLPARAGRGDWLALAVLTVAAAALGGLTMWRLSRLFVSGVQEAGVVKTDKRRLGQFDFVEGLGRATFWKDLRLISRDPLLLSKILPSTLYLLPMLFAIGGFGRTGAAALLAPFGVLVSLFLSPQLTAVATAGEEGWDLIRMSSASTVRMRIAKIAAGLALPMTFCVLIAVVTAVLGRPGLALLSVVMALISSSSACWLEVATIRPTPRRDLIQNYRLGRGASPGRALLTGVQLIAGGAGVSLAAHHQWALALVACGLTTLIAIACFTLVKPRDPEFEGAAA